MNTPIVPQGPINKQIFNAILYACQDVVDEMPDTKEIHALHKEMMARVRGKIDRDTYNIIEDLVYRAANQYGEEMFKLGITLGRNPAAVFDLPDAENAFSV